MTAAARAASAVAEAPASSALAGKYMTFRLASEDYGLPILKVRELIGLMEITRVPGAPAFVRGVINLRGKVVPVLELRARLGLPVVEAGRYAVIVVVQIDRREGPLTIGMLVDEVLEVRDIGASQLEPPPSFGLAGSEVDFILGIGKVEKRVVFLLDIDRVLDSSEIRRLPR
jgi:purine-binding chemotaxis protein CheW